MKQFYRVANNETKEGLWYGQDGEFTGLIHSRFDFCKNSELRMPFDLECIGFLSATETLEELLNWFPVEDLLKLEEAGYFVTVYVSGEYKFHNNHWLIDQRSSKVIREISIADANCAAMEYR